MTKEKLDQLVEEIKQNDSEVRSITARELINALGCERRTSNNQWYVDKYLSDNLLEVEPYYMDVWIDATITIKHKKKATTKLGKDPIKRLAILEAANREPTTVNNDTTLQEATTIMMLNNFSQLPVLSGPRSLVGYISWETIGVALQNGITSGMVKDYISKEVKVLGPETPLLKAIRSVYKNDFVVVQKQDKTIAGIITTADISSQFLTITEPFLLLEQIENHIRQILDKKFLLEDLVKLCSYDVSRSINCIDDLNFGDYLRLMQDEKNWKKLKISIDKTIFLKRLEKIKEIRNDVMHFDPEGITESQYEELKNMSTFLYDLSKYYQ